MNVIGNSRDAQLIPIDSVKPYARHARRHSKTKIGKLKKLLQQFGQVTPILVDDDNVIISGHALHTAMTELGAGEIAAISIVGRSAAEIKALRLTLNRLPLEAAWDNENLRAELQELVELSVDLDLTGFDTPEIDVVLDLDLPKHHVGDDDPELPPLSPIAVTCRGDVWQCGRHRIGCGSALEQSFLEQVRAGAKADVCFIDPPYYVPLPAFVPSKGRARHREFVQGAGELSSAEITQFLAKALRVLLAGSKHSALIYACMDWQHIFELIGAGRGCGLQLINLCVWVKTNAGIGSLYRNQHELIGVFTPGSDAHQNDVELGRLGRNRSNLWTYRGFKAFGEDRDELLASHRTAKPISMIADALRDVTKRGDVVINSFVGLGSTLIAAEETGRICCGTEIAPHYVDVAIRHWQMTTARDAVHASTGELFNDRAQRAEESEGGKSVVTDTSDDEGVGYKQPPKHSQFRPGQSGNPRGRRKNVRNFKTDLLDELREQISIRENGRERRISKQRAFIKALVAAAIKGDMRATNALVSFCTRSLGDKADEVIDSAPAADDVDIIEAFIARERKRRRKSETEPQSSNQKRQ